MDWIRFLGWGDILFSWLHYFLISEKKTFKRYRQFYAASCILLNKEPVNGVRSCIALRKKALSD